MLLLASESVIGPTLAVIVGTAGEPVDRGVDGGRSVPPDRRRVRWQLSLGCRSGPVPTQGTVVGLAAPSVQKALDEAVQAAA